MNFNFNNLRNILACPQSHARLVLDGKSLVSTDPQARLRYDIVDGIPRLLVDEATQLSVEDWCDVMRRHGHDPQTGAQRRGSDSS